ncbi:T9SS sorting signal type C domain-containing protein [Flavobacterium saccharophilum]|uniref:Delta-60 repeat domain-containing protein n=1 Tax=Flavobacterium saccharophilum TaxID=29534 RepID=A0A1M6ZHF7_9FLAO|nr:T9SS sorting signal type C domain-containing protein [Flavobacterium saccharophilum]SHL29765.1 delta-60 repeat domain-containing protein [Flavobacterium saccharophilum]
MIKNIFFSLILLCLVDKTKVYAQQGKVDSSFNTFDDGSIGDGFDNPVRTLFLQDDQNLIVGGEYLNLNGIPSPYLARLKPDGTVDESFNIGTGFNGKIYASYVQSDGKIIVGGSFSSFKGISCGRLVRLNSDGSYDVSFNTSIGATTGIVYAIASQPDGKIIIVGSFTKYNNNTVNRIARILPSGDLDTSFITGSGSILNIMNASVLTDGKILLTGNFAAFNGVPANRILRLNSDGRVDNDFNSGIGFDDNVSAVAVQQDGKIILGGKFTNYNGIVANRIIRINYDGSIDNSFFPGTGFSNGAVLTIKTNSLGSIMVGGSFSGNYNGGDVNRVCLLNSNGVLSTDVDFGSGPATASVYTLENDREGSWYIGGSFSVFDGLNQGRLAKINSEGEYDTGYLSAGVGFDNSVLKVLPLENKKTMVFGNFKKFNGVFISRIACLLEDGSLDTGFNTQQSGANNLIKNAVIQSDGKIICGGNFTKYNETLINRIVRISPDGNIDETFTVGTGFNSQVYALAVQSDNKIIVGGNFTRYNDIPSGRLIRLLPNGLPDLSFDVGLGADAIIETVLIQPDNKILVGGHFSSFNGKMVSRLVRLNADGSIDPAFNIGNGFDKYIYTIALQSDGKIILGGNFVNYNGTAQKRIVRLNADGSLDSTFQSGSGFSKGDVRSILIQPDGRIIVGGTFSGTYRNNIAMRLIRLLKSGDFDPSFDARLNSKLYTMEFTANYRLMIGGDFNSISGISKHRAARLKLCLDSTFWDGFSWSNGLPSGGKEVTFKENYPSLTTANVCSCSIEEGKVVTLLSGHTLEIEFSYFGQGTLILEDSANLYQSDDDMVNTGVINLKRKTSPILRYDYTCWSAPVEFQKLVDVSPNTLSDKYYSYDCRIKSWQLENPSNVMIPGKGYIIRGPQYFSITDPTVYESTFKGIPNNGKIEADLGDDGHLSLVGNPYPSTLNADAFLKKNASKIKGTLYFWTHNTPVTDRKYNTDDYAVYNLLGGVGTRGAFSTGINENIPDKTIASGQAFFVTSKGSGTVDFNDNMRLNYKSLAFFKPGRNEKSKEVDEVEKHRVWLNLKNEDGIFKQILVGYITGATDFYDEDFDAESINGNKFADFYSINEKRKLVIQGRSLPFDDTDSIPIGYTTTVEGDFNISIDHADGVFSTPRDFFIEDKELKIIYNLKDGPYFFSTGKGTFDDRFVLRFVDSSLKMQNFEGQKDQILVSVNKQNIFFDSTNNDIKNIVIFDLSGKQIYNKNDIKNSKFSIQNFPVKNQVLMIKITLEKGSSKTFKIFI